jgi:two-component system chemotaxis response regulator CheY
MVVDDSLLTRSMLSDILEAGGHQVIASCARGEEAVALYPELRPDLVFMDIVLDGKNGIEAAGEILLLDQAASIIVMSVLSDLNLVKAAFNLGAKDFIHKPFNAVRILKALDGHVPV